MDETIAAIEKDNKQLFIGQSQHPQAQVSMQLRIRHCYRATLNLLGAGSLHEVAGPYDCFGNTGAAPANSFDRSLGRIDRPGERTEPLNQTLCAGFGKEGPELWRQEARQDRYGPYLRMRRMWRRTPVANTITARYIGDAMSSA